MIHIQEDKGLEEVKKEKKKNFICPPWSPWAPSARMQNIFNYTEVRQEARVSLRSRKRRCNLTPAPGKSLLCPDGGRERKDQ